MNNINSETVSESVKDFTLFINQNKQTIRNNTILSFASPVKGINLIEKLNSFDKNFNDFLFYEKPEDNFSFIAVDRLISIQGDGKEFQSLASIINGLNSTLITNWSKYNFENFPFVTGGAKFDPGKSSEEWNDFNPLHFFVPRMIIFNNKDKTYLVYNFQPGLNPDIQTEINKFEDFSSSVLSSNSSTFEKENFTIKPNGNNDGGLQNWKKMVANATDNLNREFKKVVLSRRIIYRAEDEINWEKCFQNLEVEYANCFLFMLKSNGSRFFGASPEKFISINSNEIEIDALAATASENQKDFVSELMTDKNIKEHKLVIEFIKEVLLNYTEKIDINNYPQIKKFKDVRHLYTKIKAEIQSRKNILKLIDSMYPTPAVCGLPKQKAMSSINQLENFDRGLFSGLIGWMDTELDCEFAVAIRSALLKNKKLFVYAGAGIVEESVPDEEFAETESKLNTILNLFDEKS